MLGVTAVLLVLLCYTQYETDLGRAKTHVGFVASVMTILFFAAPLTMLVRYEFLNFYSTSVCCIFISENMLVALIYVQMFLEMNHDTDIGIQITGLLLVCGLQNFQNH